MSEQTIEPCITPSVEEDGAPLGLTILFHPDVSRVGETTVLFPAPGAGAGPGIRRRVSRTEPFFQPPRGGPSRPLDTAVISRDPIWFESGSDESVGIAPGTAVGKLRVDGRALADVAWLQDARLERGVVLGLGSTVLLLLHRLAPRPLPDPQGLVGESLVINDLRRRIESVADLDETVLLLGETGSGKELAAHAIHQASSRRRARFVAVNVAALPPDLAASALFGHRKGAFSGAVEHHEGYFQAARGGTLFLDEIGEMRRELQPLLLRAIRQREIQPLGTSRIERVDVRLIAATDGALQEQVTSGEFSAALWHRLRGYTLGIPPLRERPDDIARLFFHFLREELARTGEVERLEEPPATRKTWIPPELVAALVAHSWPGNVGELETVASQLVISNRGEKRLRVPPELPWLVSSGNERGRDFRSHALPPLRARGQRLRPHQIPEASLATALAEHGYRVEATARALSVSKSWLIERMGELQSLRKVDEISPEEFKAAIAEHGDDVQALSAALRISVHGVKLRRRALQKLGLL